jgi:hypothetical protein
MSRAALAADSLVRAAALPACWSSAPEPSRRLQAPADSFDDVLSSQANLIIQTIDFTDQGLSLKTPRCARPPQRRAPHLAVPRATAPDLRRQS